MPTFSASYGCDKLNRLTSASDTGLARTFGYDENGNLWLTGNSGVNMAGNTPTSNVFNASNRMAGNTYDLAGNQSSVNGNSVVYDAENHQITATEPASLGGATENYRYDGLGQRVEKAGPNGAFLYLYDAFGQLAAEYANTYPSSSSSWATLYLSYDHLGNVRLCGDAELAYLVVRDDNLDERKYGQLG